MKYKETFWLVHKKLFPKQTAQMQLNKFNEEWQEYLQAKTNPQRIAELIDCYIVALSMKPYSEVISESLIDTLTKELNIYAIDYKNTWKRIDRKIEVIKKRKYELRNKQYQHKEVQDEIS